MHKLQLLQWVEGMLGTWQGQQAAQMQSQQGGSHRCWLGWGLGSEERKVSTVATVAREQRRLSGLPATIIVTPTSV